MSRIRADKLVNRAGSGGPKFPNGIADGFSVTGIVTATSFSGPVTGNADTATSATSATTATTASALGSGATGSDLTLSGNLTVNGTTTTIDTAVTAVDSLAVEGSVGIGTDNPGTKLDVRGGNWSNGDIVVGELGNAGKVAFRRGADGSDAAYIGYDGASNNSQVALAVNSADGTILFKTNSEERLRITSAGLVGVGGNGTGSGLGVYLQRSSPATTHFYEASDGTKKMIAGVDSGNDYVKIGSLSNHPVGLVAGNTERLRIDQHGTTKFKGPLTEKARYEGVTLNGDYNHDLITHGNVAWLDTAAGAAFALNLRGSATVDLNDMMSTGESLSFWFAHACASNTAYYMNAFKVDGTTISGTDILWSGGSAPTAAGGGSGTKDVYAFTVFKTANATFRAFASVTNHG